MFVLGEGNNAFGSIAGTLIPFITVIKDLLKQTEAVTGNGNGNVGDGEVETIVASE